LYQEGGAQPLRTVLTGEDGRYRFDGLWPGDYHLEADLPPGLIFVRPGDPNYARETSAITRLGQGMGEGEPFRLRMAQDRLNDNILYIRPARLGSLAWLDTNQNGLLDGGEPMIPGVAVRLVDNGETVAETQTDAFGYYLFEAVYPGTYTLQVTAYPELGITGRVPEYRLISNCLAGGDGTSAVSEPFALQGGMSETGYLLGFVLKPGYAKPAAIVPPPAKDWTGSFTGLK